MECFDELIDAFGWIGGGPNTTALIESISAGWNWISFRWRSSVEECHRLLTGFALKITDVNNPTKTMLTNNSLVVTDEPVVFNTSYSGWYLEPCSNYSVQLTPVFNVVTDFVGAPSLPFHTMTPGLLSNNSREVDLKVLIDLVFPVPKAVPVNEISVSASDGTFSWGPSLPQFCINGYTVAVVEEVRL